MGQNFSTRRDYWIHKYSNPRVEKFQTQLLIRLEAGPDGAIKCVDSNPFQERIINPNDDHQRVIICALSHSYVRNELSIDAEVRIEQLFTPKAPGNHVDHTGCVRVICPSRFQGSVAPHHQILYRPKLYDEYIELYSGLEDAVVATVRNEGGVCVLEDNHPLLYFIRENLERLEITPLRRLENGFCEIPAEALDRAQQFFRNTIYEHILPTRFEDTKIVCDNKTAEAGSICIMFDVEYLVITPGELKLKHREVYI